MAFTPSTTSASFQDARPEIRQQVDDIFQVALESALQGFRTCLTREEDKDFQSTTLDHVKREIIHLQKRQGENKTMMNCNRLMSFLEAMDQWGQVASTFADCSECVAFVWGPVKFLLSAASVSPDPFDTLLDAYEKIGIELPLLRRYQDLFNQSPELRGVLKQMYYDILQFHRQALRFFSGPAWKNVFQAFWKDFKTGFDGILRALKLQRILIERQAAGFGHSQQYRQDRIELLDTTPTNDEEWDVFRAKIKEQERDVRKKQCDDAQRWFDPTSPTRKHEQACEERLQFEKSGESGRWILEKPQIKHWISADTPDSSMLWVNGIPGAGKTILASLIIEECIKEPDSKTCYFYCVHKDPFKDNFMAVIKSLLSQSLSQSPSLVAHCYDKEKRKREPTLQSSKQAEDLLETFFQAITQTPVIRDGEPNFEKQYIIIDGLDECEDSEYERLIGLFQKIATNLDKVNLGRFRVMFISQHLPQTEKALGETPSLSIRPEDNEKDIHIYTRERSKKLQELWNLTDDDAEGILEKTRSEAKGVFLYARLVMDNLSKQRTREEFRKEVQEKFPKGLEGAYERIMNRIHRHSTEKDWAIIKKLLGWVICARKQLTWWEIKCANSIDVERNIIDFEEKGLVVHIRDMCGSLLEASSDDAVRFVHSTASMYILETKYVDEFLAEISLTTTCLDYLSLPYFADSLQPGTIAEFAVRGNYIFQDYSVSRWSEQLVSMIQRGATDNLSTAATEYKEALTELKVALKNFTNLYGHEFMRSPGGNDLNHWQIHLGDADSYEHLCAVKTHIQRHVKSGFEARTKISIPTLEKSFTASRKFLEDPKKEPYKCNLSTAQMWNLDEQYGKARYKCPKLNCRRFYEGFKVEKDRKKHCDTHDRPFKCEIEECQGHEFGFTSAHDLDKHRLKFHPTAAEQSESFEPLDNKTTTTAKWTCPQCPKRFTRGFHLKNHVRTHNNEKPFHCRKCGKPFTRNYDRKRHEKIHSKYENTGSRNQRAYGDSQGSVHSDNLALDNRPP